MTDRVVADGKFFALRGRNFGDRSFGGQRFQFRATRYTLSAGSDADADLAQLARSGFTAIASTAGPELLAPFAKRHRLRVVQLLPHVSWESLLNGSRRQRLRFVQELTGRIGRQVSKWSEHPGLLAVAVGPGAQPEFKDPRQASVLSSAGAALARAIHDEHPDLLLTWLGSTASLDCPLEFDYLTAFIDDADPRSLRNRLLSAHLTVGDRPLVAWCPTIRTRKAAESFTRTALEAGAGGLMVDSLAPGLEPATLADLNALTVGDLDIERPSTTVVVCAYNAQETLDECLSACDLLDYPDLEILVVNDGSTDSTPDIINRHARARELRVPHGGLSAARNVGYRAARGELIAYLDSDAYPPPEWIHYLGFAAGDVGLGGAGGPNVPPISDPPAAQVVARSPGGPLPELKSADRAVHVPGCNMAFHRKVLEELGGFDEALWTASDDLEFHWRMSDAGYEIGYHPAALVWHHRRPGLRRYLRQQRGYGRSQAIVEARYPERFPPGFRLHQLSRLFPISTQPADRPTKRVAYRSLYSDEPIGIRLAHQWGVPAAVLAAATAPLGLVKPRGALPAAAGLLYSASLFVTDVVRAGRDTRPSSSGSGYRANVAVHRLLRPLAFRWGHAREKIRFHGHGRALS